MEKLVEEIRLLWCEDCIDGPSRYEYAPDFGDEPCESGAETVKLCRERAGKVVAYILSAFRDGLSFELIEEIAALEHEQWMEWSKHVAGEVSPGRRARWEAYWIPYKQLSEEVKEHDRIWARKIIALSGTSQGDPMGGKEEEK